MAKQVDIAVIGAGIVGLATSLELRRRRPDLSLVILDKEARVGAHQTGHNSGVVHSGIYYKPGSLKATLCREGRLALLDFCEKNGVSYQQCGKLILATCSEELPGLNTLYERGVQNGLQGLRRLQAEEIQEWEPHAAGVGGILVPETGVVDYGRVAETFANLISQSGATICLSHEVVALERSGAITIIETLQTSIAAKIVINCAGLHSDHVSALAGAKLDLKIVPFRGEYYDVAKTKQHLIKGLIYPVPDPRFPFLGVHFTTRIGGGVEAGPNAVLAFEREGYKKTSFAIGDVWDCLTYPGFWIMAEKYWRMSLAEYHRSWSKRAFVRALQRMVPEIQSQDLVPGGAGVRAQALDRKGQLLDDFHFAYTEGMVHVCNVPSPAATASLAIGRHIVDIVLRRFSSLV